MIWLLLVATHLVVAIAFYLLGRTLGVRIKEVRMANEHDPIPPPTDDSWLVMDELEHPDEPATTHRGGRDWKKWLAIGLLFIVVAAQGLWDQHERKQQQDCITNYINGSGQLVQARDDTLQHVLDDVANGQNVDGGATPEEVQAFYRHLAAEQAAYRAMQDFRETQVPAKACPQ